MHEKCLQKTHMLSEVSDQQRANSTKILSPTGTSPHPTKANHSPSPDTNQSPRQERVNTKQVDLKTITSTSRRSLMKRVTTRETHRSHRLSSKT